jgi:hypothetical protein
MRFLRRLWLVICHPSGVWYGAKLGFVMRYHGASNQDVIDAIERGDS